MTGTLTVPTIGQPNSTEDQDIRDALNTLNGLLTSSNLLDGAQLGAVSVAAAALASNSVTTAKIADANVTDAKLASPNNSVYKMLLDGVVPIKDNEAAGTYQFNYEDTTGGVFNVASGETIGLALSTSYPVFGRMIYFDDADFTVGGLTQKLRLRALLATNATSLGTQTVTAGLYPVTVAGTTDNLLFTLGTVVSGSTATFVNPSASTITPAVSGDFTIPADGAYALGFTLSASMANNSAALLSAQLQTRNV